MHLPEHVCVILIEQECDLRADIRDFVKYILATVTSMEKGVISVGEANAADQELTKTANIGKKCEEQRKRVIYLIRHPQYMGEGDLGTIE